MAESLRDKLAGHLRSRAVITCDAGTRIGDSSARAIADEVLDIVREHDGGRAAHGAALAREAGGDALAGVTESSLASALESFFLDVELEVNDVRNGCVHDPDEVARVLYATLGRMAALREPQPHPFAVSASSFACRACGRNRNDDMHAQAELDAEFARSPAAADPELAAIARILAELDALSGGSGAGLDSVSRVLDYVTSRYDCATED